jgi:hypothetical protein
MEATIMESSTPGILAMIHLMVLSLWGGVVATESVIELFPFRRPAIHPATIRLHYWIDLVVEGPLVVAVVTSGVGLLLLTSPITPLHLVKVGCAAGAVVVNVVCIALVVRRGQLLHRNVDASRLWWYSRRILVCFGVGLACAGVAAAAGFTLALSRMG